MSEGKQADVTTAAPLFLDDAAGVLVAAHELKSPLALIRQLAFSLESGQADTEEYKRLVYQIRLTSERALRLMSDVTRSSRGRRELLFDLEPLNPIGICEEVAHELGPLYKAQDKKIHVHNRSHPPLLVGNRDLLKRILLNFGDNALHYAASEDPVVFGVYRAGDAVRIGLRDFGPAVEPQLWQQLIGRLEALVAQPVSARPQSSGLGLYIAGQFAQMMNGKIGAIRHRDGATFYVDMVRSCQLSLL